MNDNDIHPLVRVYQSIERRPVTTREAINVHCVNGPTVAIVGIKGGNYDVEFIDATSGELVHKDRIARNWWTKANRTYYSDWKIKVTCADDGRVLFDGPIKLQGHRVFIALDSKALGDTLAWIPFVEEFRLKHGCHVICSTFWNELVAPAYPQIQFIEPGQPVPGLIAQYTVGCFDITNRHMSPTPWNTVSLQSIAAGILGLTRREIRPRVANVQAERPVPEPYVCIATHSTAQAKFWNRPGGWETVVEWLNKKGFKVFNLSYDAKPVYGTIHVPKGSVLRVAAILKHAECFVGLPSGLSWLAWALEKPVVMVSGFSLPWFEFESGRLSVSPTGDTCKGCFNKYVFDPGDWQWCPEHKDSERQFECTKQITPEEVIAAVESVLPSTTGRRGTIT